MKKHNQEPIDSEKNLGNLYPEPLSYQQKADLDKQAFDRRNKSKPSFPAFRIGLAMTGVIALCVYAIKLVVWLFAYSNVITAVFTTFLLSLLIVGSVIEMHSYVNRLFGDKSTNIFFIIYLILFFVAGGIITSIGWADFIKISELSIIWSAVIFLVHLLVVYLLAGLFIGFKKYQI